MVNTEHVPFWQSVIEHLLHDGAAWVVHQAEDGVHILNANCPQITTLAIITCAGGAMVAPLFGSAPGKWYARAIGAFWIGAVWRVLT